ncbi:MAG: radical SAM protein [Candidatus Omnitrophota bacterium]|nr:radical SAM protein [Candidatus Omnitrophota bacterium]
MAKNITKKNILNLLVSLIKNKIGIPAPLVLSLMLTYNCNLHCPKCNVKHNRRNFRGKELTTEKVIGLIDQSRDLGASILYLQGGEPLIRNDVGKILRHAKNKGMITFLTTNGCFIKDKIDQISDSLDYLRISLYSLKKQDDICGVKGSFDRIMEGLELCRQKGINTTITAVISDDTIQEMEEFARFSNRVGCKITYTKMLNPDNQYSLAVDNNMFMANLKKLRKKYKNIKNLDYFLFDKNVHLTCRGASMVLSIDPDGRLFLPCNLFPILKIDTMNSSLKKIWNDPKLGEMRQRTGYYDFCKGCINRCYLFPSMCLSFSGLWSIFKQWY